MTVHGSDRQIDSASELQHLLSCRTRLLRVNARLASATACPALQLKLKNLGSSVRCLIKTVPIVCSEKRWMCVGQLQGDRLRGLFCYKISIFSDFSRRSRSGPILCQHFVHPRSDECLDRRQVISFPVQRDTRCPLPHEFIG